MFKCRTMTITFEEILTIVKLTIPINQTKSTQCVFKPLVLELKNVNWNIGDVKADKHNSMCFSRFKYH